MSTLAKGYVKLYAIDEDTAEILADFMTAHPCYVPSHVLAILRHANTMGIPYCSECHDWHTPNVPHSI